MAISQRASKKTKPREARLDVRLNQRAKETIEQAAVVSHQTLTDFVVTSLLRASDEVLKRHQTVKLTSRYRDLFLSVLDRAEPPNRALRKAAKRFKSEFG